MVEPCETPPATDVAVGMHETEQLVAVALVEVAVLFALGPTFGQMANRAQGDEQFAAELNLVLQEVSTAQL